MKTLIFPVTLVLVLVTLFQDISSVPSPRKVIEADGSTYNEDDCEDAAKDAENNGACAVIFEKTECDLPDFGIGFGDKKEIPEGKWTGLRLTGFHEDLESIIVRPGCIVFGYDEDHKDIRDRGQTISVSAVGKKDWVYRELEDKFDLKDDIEAVECFCGEKAKQMTQYLPLPEAGFIESITSFGKKNTAVGYCNLWIYAFNRLPIKERPCAILFESEDCETSDGVIFTDWNREILPSSKIVTLPRVSLGAKKNSAESVLVRPGCSWTGYDEDNGQGKEVTVTADRNSKTPKFYPLASKYNPFKLSEPGLKEDINSFKCTCA